MKVSESWLREWVNPKWDTQILAEELSLAGLEVDEVCSVAPEFSNVVIGHVLSVEKHPDADKLNVTQVDVGDGEPVQIVCGAKNVVAGMKACCAKVGAVLPGEFKIKKAKLRGVPSHGMLCGATEIGLPDDGVDGLHMLPEDAPIGVDVREYLSLNDVIIDVDLTPNRADCLSVEGLARDIAAISGEPIKVPFELEPIATTGACHQEIKVEENTACPKYLGCLVTGYDTGAQTPDWMKARLERSGISPKSLTVDITNYVLLELGQPMHAFDADKLQGVVQVRMAKDGEKLTTLDEKELVLQNNTLVIADDSGPIALAGIMGGLSSAVSDATQAIFFECAHFAPLAITGRARQYGLHTDSSHRFERGVDAFLPERAMARALQLFTEIAGGQVSDVKALVNEAALHQPKAIQLRPERVEKLLGVVLSNDEIEKIFQRLNFIVETNDEGWLMTAPSYRFDMAIEADLIEEIGRVYGYNNLPEVEVNAPMRLPKLEEQEQEMQLIRQVLVNKGYHEAVTYSFVEENTQQKLFPEQKSICLQNPISDDMRAMRVSLLPGLLSTVAYNQNRQQSRLRLFETGLVFLSEDASIDRLQQIPMIGGVIVGSVSATGWSEEDRPVDFYDMKGHVESLLALSHVADKVRFEAKVLPIYHPGQSAVMVMDGEEIGSIGQLHPGHVKTLGVSGKVFMFEMRLDTISTTRIPSAKAISKFPIVQRDLAFVVEQSLPVQAVLDALGEVSSEIVQSIELFDLYQGAGLGENQKSVALTIKLQHQDRTLQDEEVDALMQQMIEAAKHKVSAELR
ncbi:phenylalanine--tRNA ligase subunit beta [Hydrogenovibrio sp. JE_KL2]|uniref:phenylalanine--tRNA ligase subunit beta n=1 Tax=Hydrogenovibrio sp. JE_KL2 TaxID=2651188 RepID=UPI00128E5F04|nr:phenylalanine--tRNA ligase subunit beta [Hydrogenovibrio sp. JE_KL2]MPQ75485.1 phenylalanine--tRNA ligase subunit beta [Hydrogenovibrio sp. JE_KL2]